MTAPKLSGLTRCVAIALAICLAGQFAWGHTFPEVHTIVIQTEACEVAVLVGYRPASGESTEQLLGRIASSPKPARAATAKALLTSQALGPLTFSIDGKPLTPTSVEAKVGVDPDGTRPMVVVLVTFAIPPGGGTLAVTSREPRTTRISWTDRDSHRVDLDHAPGQVKWFTGVASFLLKLAPSWGACDTPSSP
jgi:hypothetical protein